jgi:hypothetical protein
MSKFTKFAAVCKALGKIAKDYAIPKDGTHRQKADMYRKRLMMVSLAYNGDGKIDMADTSQWKYYPWFRIVPDKRALAGFRLSYDDFDCDTDATTLGARPKFLRSEDAVEAGQAYEREYEAWEQHEALAQAEGDF